MPINISTDKQTVHLDNGTLHSNEEKVYNYIHNNMVNLKNNVELKVSDTKESI